MLALSLAATSANAQSKRVALVIGNSKYASAPLRNPSNDADDVSTLLKSLDFQVTTLKDVSKSQFEGAVDEVTSGLGKGDLCLIFYAGHGQSMGSTNYLIPVDAVVERPQHVEQRCVSVDYLLSALKFSNCSLKIVIVDACRNNPFRGFLRSNSGLTRLPEAPEGTIVSFSTSPKTAALDGANGNSPFARHLVSTFRTQSDKQNLLNLFVTTSRAVRTETGQRPHLQIDASMPEYFLRPRISNSAASVKETMQPDRRSSNSALATAESGLYRDLKWMPKNAELFVHLDFKKIRRSVLRPLFEAGAENISNSPIGSVGVQLEDLEALSIGFEGVIKPLLDNAASPFDPNRTGLIAVVHSNRPMKLSEIQTKTPDAELVNFSDSAYLRFPFSPPLCVSLPSPDTIVLGNESDVRMAITEAAGTFPDSNLKVTNGALQVVLSPPQREVIFDHETIRGAEKMMPPAIAQAIKAIRTSATALALDLDIDDNLTANLSVASKDDSGAMTLKSALGDLRTDSVVTGMLRSLHQIPGAVTVVQSAKIEASGKAVNVAMTMPASQLTGHVNEAIGSAQRMETVKNMRAIMLSIMNYESTHARFPDAWSQDTKGRKLLSWRVHILPYLGHSALYKRFRLDEPWDSPHNMQLLAEMPGDFESPHLDLPPGVTAIQIPVGPGTAFEGGKGPKITDLTDGLSNTIMLVEVTPPIAVPWTQPRDYAFDPKVPAANLANASNKFLAAFFDGAVTDITLPNTKENLSNMFIRNDYNSVDR